ncbi:MAG: amino acid ABC transporter permease [Parachlamydiales bacterium]|jgi:polar amino acid transport system permease protein
MNKFLVAIQIFLGVALVSFTLFLLLSLGNLQWSEVWAYRKVFWNGWKNTVYISVCSLGLSLAIGIFTALLRRSGIPLAVFLSRFFVELIRGTPLLVQILFFYYVVAHQVGLENRFIAGIIILSIFHAAYIAEMIRTGIENVSATQLESAHAIGLTTFQSYRFVIFPQAIRQVTPPLAGQFASIIKDSSLLSIIGINELTNSAQQVNSATYSTLESFFPLALGYLILTLPISLLSKKLENRFHYET